MKLSNFMQNSLIACLAMCTSFALLQAISLAMPPMV